MKAFELSIGSVIFRFYLMMAVVIAAGFIGQWWLAILALPIFLSIMAGVSFTNKRTEARIRTIEHSQLLEKKVG